MKKNIALVLVLCLSLMAAACGKPAETGDGGGDDVKNVIKIGVFEPASGDNGAGGKQETLGIQYANLVSPTVEIGGVTYDVVLDIVDNESSNDKGPTAAAKLVNDQVSIVLGSYGSGVSIAASDVFGNAGIPVLGVTCTNPQVTEGNTHYFRICYLDPFQGTVLANYAVETMGATKAYCLSKLGDDYSVGLANYFKKAFIELGGTVVEDQFPDGNSDFTSYIANAKNAGADVFFSPVSTEAAALIIDQAHSQGANIPLLAGDTWDSNVIMEAAKGKNVSVTVSTFFIEGSDDPQVVEFVDGIKEWFNSDATALANNGGNDELAAVTAMGFDAYFTALEAIKLAGSTDPADIMQALWKTTYTGVSGAIGFDDIGDAIRDNAYIKTLNNQTGAWEFVTVQGI